MGRSERKSGIELLRMIAILGVVLLHYNDGRALLYTQGGQNMYVLFFLESLCICAVNVFILISGFFLSGTQKRSYIKPLELIVQLIVFRVIFYLIGVALGQRAFSLSSVLYNMVPNSYFVMLYCALYCISPYLNRIFAGFTQKQWIRFLLVILILFSIWPTITDLMEEVLGVQWVGISTITLKGAHQGFNIVNFSLLYSVGAYFRFNDVPKLFNTRKRQIAGIFAVTAVIFIWALCTQNLKLQEMRSAWMYHNPLVILQAALIFVLFRSFLFKSRVINELAGASFTCFLLHGYLLDYTGIERYSAGNVFVMLGHVMVVLIGCYLISYVVYKSYSMVTGWLFRLLQQKVRFFQGCDDI